MKIRCVQITEYKAKNILPKIDRIIDIKGIISDIAFPGQVPITKESLYFCKNHQSI